MILRCHYLFIRRLEKLYFYKFYKFRLLLSIYKSLSHQNCYNSDLRIWDNNCTLMFYHGLEFCFFFKDICLEKTHLTLLRNIESWIFLISQIASQNASS